jgi:hypothetical protein
MSSLSSKCEAQLLALELKIYKTMVSAKFPARLVAVAMALTAALGIGLPLLLSGKFTFQEAEDTCLTRREQIIELDIYAFDSLLPQHGMLSGATAASLLSFYVWLFKSPHRLRAEAQDLDVRLGTFFMAQLGGCFVLLWSSPLEICTTHSTRYLVLYYVGLSCGPAATIGSSLLCHKAMNDEVPANGAMCWMKRAFLAELLSFLVSWECSNRALVYPPHLWARGRRSHSRSHLARTAGIFYRCNCSFPCSHPKHPQDDGVSREITTPATYQIPRPCWHKRHGGFHHGPLHKIFSRNGVDGLRVQARLAEPLCVWGAPR